MSFTRITIAIALTGLCPLHVLAQQSTPDAPAQAAQPKAPAKPKVYDEKADAKEQIAQALARAAKDNKRVLIQWGGNWCSWCIRLDALFKSDNKIAREILYEYELVHIDSGQNGKNVELAASYGADLKKHGYPFLTVLDAAGKAIANQETAALEVKDKTGESVGVAAGHDPQAVLKFLQDHKAAYRVADDVLKQGLDQAKTSGKLGFVHFGAPWCVWCHRMEAWMDKPEITALLSKQFVDIKIDVDRMIGGKAVIDSFSAGKHGGIPYFVITDADGKPLCDSIAASGNVGFPSAPDEIAHFESMLKKAASKLSPDDVRALVESLKTKPKPETGAPAAHP